MTHFLHQFDFTLYRLSSVWFFEFVLLVNFKSNFSIRWFVKTDSHDRICSLSNLLPDYVVIKTVVLTKDHSIIKSSWGLLHLLLSNLVSFVIGLQLKHLSTLRLRRPRLHLSNSYILLVLSLSGRRPLIHDWLWRRLIRRDSLALLLAVNQDVLNLILFVLNR